MDAVVIAQLRAAVVRASGEPAVEYMAKAIVVQEFDVTIHFEDEEKDPPMMFRRGFGFSMMVEADW